MGREQKKGDLGNKIMLKKKKKILFNFFVNTKKENKENWKYTSHVI